MNATAKELRFHSKELLDTVARGGGEEVVITSMELIQGMRNKKELKVDKLSVKG